MILIYLSSILMVISRILDDSIIDESIYRRYFWADER